MEIEYDLLTNVVDVECRLKGMGIFYLGDNFYRNSVNMIPICLIFWYVSTNWGPQRIV